MKLNLGCGRDIREGWTNVDRFPGPGVDVVADLDDLPFPDGSAEHVYASHVLEHVVDFAATWQEIHRVLAVGGTLHGRVPYGLNTDPFHVRYFDERSIPHMIGAGGPVGFRDRATQTSSLERDAAWYEAVSVSYLYSHNGFPRWHVWHYLHRELPVLRKKLELAFVLCKKA